MSKKKSPLGYKKIDVESAHKLAQKSVHVSFVVFIGFSVFMAVMNTTELFSILGQTIGVLLGLVFGVKFLTYFVYKVAINISSKEKVNIYNIAAIVFPIVAVILIIGAMGY